MSRPEQAPAWVAGRATAARNLANAAQDLYGVTVVSIDVERLDAESSDSGYDRSISAEWGLALGSPGARR